MRIKRKVRRAPKHRAEHRVYVYPYSPYSKSAKTLADALGCKRIRVEGSRFIPSIRKTVINWGATHLPMEYHMYPHLNDPGAVRRACDKIAALHALLQEDVSIPDFTCNPEEALGLLAKGPVVCRTIINGHSGRGITIAKTEQELVAAPLYTQYIKKKSEWRVHIFLNEVIMVQRKVRNKDVPDDEVNWHVRNHGNGFIYQQNDINPPDCVIEQAMDAVHALSLDFGAVDVIYNEFHDKAYVLEVNCAPGLEGTTVNNYVNAIKREVFRND